MFKKRYLKGIKGVVSAKDLERYLEDLMILERELHSRDVKIGLLETRLSKITKELNHGRKVSKHQEEVIQKQRTQIADLQLQLEMLNDLKSSLERENKEMTSKLSSEKIGITARDDLIRLQEERDKLSQEVKRLGKELKNRDSQIKKLTEENVLLKDKLRYLKRSRF